MRNSPLAAKAVDHAAARLVSIRDVLALTSISRGTLYIWIKQGHFPKPVQIGKRRVAWREQQVRDWISSRETTAWAA
jgi:prophage regulatory protein